MNRAALCVAAGLAGLLTGCDRLQADRMSLADRCGEILQKAMPAAKIELGARSSAGTGLRTIVASVTGTRTDLPDNTQVERDLAAECTFEDTVLTGFRWIKGGPPPN